MTKVYRDNKAILTRKIHSKKAWGRRFLPFLTQHLKVVSRNARTCAILGIIPLVGIDSYEKGGRGGKSNGNWVAMG